MLECDFAFSISPRGTGRSANVLHFQQSGERTLIEQLASAGAAYGAEFDDVVGFEQEIEVMLDHDHGVTLIDQGMEDMDQFFAVAEVQADGRFFQ